MAEDLLDDADADAPLEQEGRGRVTVNFHSAQFSGRALTVAVTLFVHAFH